jgi:hypothetical protein
MNDTLKAEIVATVARRLDNMPRSTQSAIGPSELGAVCTRKLAHRIAGTERRNPSGSWRSGVGTAVHAFLADTFDEVESHDQYQNDRTRYLIERRVHVGNVGGQEIWGSADLFDMLTGTVVDWKIVGNTSLRAARMIGPKPQYRTQVHCYGRGFVGQGYVVSSVAIMWLPSAGDLRDAVWWSEPYDESVALEGLQRADGIANTLAYLGPEAAIPLMPMAEDYCASCPFHLSSARSDAVDACRGVRNP